ncbi:hypothetical protein GCM10028784_25060 [Myceligenerans cantabricum]
MVVAGAGGYVGSRLTAGLSRAGRTVLAASRRPLPEGLLSDGGPGPGLVWPVIYGDTEGLGAAVRDLCEREELSVPGGAVASIGGWHLGARLLDEPGLDGWRNTLDSHLTAHLAAARSLVPLLREATDPLPAYVVLNGAARAVPMRGSGPINVTGAALAMLVRVLRLEEGLPQEGPADDDGTPEGAGPPDARRRVRFHELVIDHAVAGDDRNVAPEHTVPPATVTATLARILDEPTASAVVHAH